DAATRSHSPAPLSRLSVFLPSSTKQNVQVTRAGSFTLPRLFSPHPLPLSDPSIPRSSRPGQPWRGRSASPWRWAQTASRSSPSATRQSMPCTPSSSRGSRRSTRRPLIATTSRPSCSPVLRGNSVEASISMSSQKFMRLVRGVFISFFGQTILFSYTLNMGLHFAGDVSLMPDVSVDLVSNMMEDGKKPSVAAIQGLALGGGLELIMGCHARISTPEAQLGLPELTLGVIPGFGGTQRLPRLVGLPKAIEMMLQSKFITAKEGKERGLIDALCSPDELIKMSRFWALEIANYRKPWIKSLGRTDRLGSLSEARAVLSMARQQAKKVAPNMPQHQACLDVVEEGVLYGGQSGVVKEAKVFKELVLSTTSRALVHVFFAQRSTTKVPGVTDIQLKPRKIRKVAVIGGGLMGSGIATALLVSNISVVLKEVNPQFLQRGQKTIAG
uniref:3-hydroxyacyl-CoA dehydrogenase NAD binding domain-containing protein n=1 Tax=Aegilops tauschii subsp. strangulata TaxID=200361 RepID=A0A453ND54_AEGTS